MRNPSKLSSPVAVLAVTLLGIAACNYALGLDKFVDVPCDPATCLKSPCQTASCDSDGQCAATAMPAGAACAREGGAGVCDAQGACVECNLTKDCATGVCSSQ